MSESSCSTLRRDKAIGLAVSDEDNLPEFVHMVLPEINIHRVKLVEKINLDTMAEAKRVVLRVVIWDAIGNKYGAIIQIGSEYPDDNMLEIANEYQQEIIMGRLGYHDSEFRDSYVVIFCHNDPFGKGKLQYNFDATKRTANGKLSRAPYIRIYNSSAQL